jgi:hypothetical protein
MSVASARILVGHVLSYHEGSYHHPGYVAHARAGGVPYVKPGRPPRRVEASGERRPRLLAHYLLGVPGWRPRRIAQIVHLLLQQIG